MEDNDFKNYANSFQAIARLRLEGIECLLGHLGNPHRGLKYIHVAGTNGKGSVCSFLQSIFTCAGYRTGKYISPNLISVCERISVDGEMIPETDLDRLLMEVYMGAAAVFNELGEMPTQFEVWTAAAFLYFKEKQCDIVVLETGLGGTRDATNIIEENLASVITRLDLDHTEYLGDTLEQIAGEKAGIIKKANDGMGICISAKQEAAAQKVLKEHCAAKDNRLVVAGNVKSLGFENFSERFDYTSADGVEICGIRCGLCGIYQPENAALAIEAALALGVDVKHIKKGIENAVNPARFEIINSDLAVIYDGAHNKNGMEALCACLKRYFPDWKGGVFVMGFMGDKDMDAAFDCLKTSGLMEGSQIFAVTVKDNSRAASAEEIANRAMEHGMDAVAFEDIDKAYHAARAKGAPVIVCGSLYLYKDFSEVREPTDTSTPFTIISQN